MKKLLLALCLFISCVASAKNNVVNVYIWSGYVPNNILQQFTKETGIKVNLAEYDTNETMYAKLKAASNSGYDIVVPSTYFIDRMSRQNMLHQIDKNSIPNFKYINPSLLHKEFDPNNNYCVPYMWGATGIVVNKKYINPNEVTSWQDLWKPQFKNQLMMLSDMREVFAMALLTLGYSGNDTNPEHIKQAYQKLKGLLPNVKIFNSDAEQTIYIDEDATIGMGWNGDIHLSQLENPNIQFIYPKDKFVIWIDCFAITNNAPHLDNAHKLINFLLQPEIAKEISQQTGYTSANMAAVKLLPKTDQENQTMNPPAAVLKRAEVQTDIGAALPLYSKYWEMLKVGE